jgi:hypothetical protein
MRGLAPVLEWSPGSAPSEMMVTLKINPDFWDAGVEPDRTEFLYYYINSLCLLILALHITCTLPTYRIIVKYHYDLLLQYHIDGYQMLDWIQHFHQSKNR